MAKQKTLFDFRFEKSHRMTDYEMVSGKKTVNISGYMGKKSMRQLPTPTHGCTHDSHRDGLVNELRGMTPMTCWGMLPSYHSTLTALGMRLTHLALFSHLDLQILC